jgi:hypothetical protein
MPEKKVKRQAVYHFTAIYVGHGRYKNPGESYITSLPLYVVTHEDSQASF